MRTRFSFSKKLLSPFLNLIWLLVLIFSTSQSFAQVNLALNKPATASSVQMMTSYTADLAFDGNTTGNSRWSSNTGATAWIYVDLQAVYNITQISLWWEAASGRDYQLQVASANPEVESSWTTIRTVTGNTTSGSYLNYTGLTGNGRYVRMNGTARNNVYGYSLFEFQVFGTANAPPVISSNGGLATASISMAENIAAVTTVNATDENVGTLTYAIVGGADAGKFTLNPTSRALSFNSPYPNFEAPGSAAGSNTYTVIVRVTDNGGLTDDQTITVTVTNVNEAPVVGTITTSPQVANTALQKAIANLVATDPDGGSNAIGSFRIVSAPTSGTLYINNVAVTSGNSFTATNNQLSGLSFTPAAGFTGNATFTYSATDKNTPTAATSTTANYIIPVTADNAATYTYTAATGYSKFGLQNGAILATATDPNGTITEAVVTGTALPAFLTLNANGNITVNSTTVVAGTYNSTVTLTDIRGGRTIDLPLTLVITNDNYQANANAIKTGENCYQLTADVANQRGQVWRATPISLSNAFEISFHAFFGNHDGADGIAFGFQRTSNPLFAVGAPGEGIGFGHGASAATPRSGGITPSIAIEFDTHNNNNVNITTDLAADHIAIFKNGEERQPVLPAVQMSSTSANVEDNATHLIQIVWKNTSNTLYVYFDGVLRQQYSEDFVSTVFGNNPSVYFGYTASTGSLTNLQSVCDITLNPLDSDGDGVADALDLDDDNDGIPDTLESNGVDPTTDIDNDGLPNFRDTTPGGGIVWVDTNNDGVNDTFDKDRDGIINAFDLDSDGDGITDVVEQAPYGFVPATDYDNNTGRLTSLVNANGIPSSSLTLTNASLDDRDGDGLKNFLDIDSDNDGLRDYLEAQATPGQTPVLPAGTDADRDGIDDRYDGTCGCTTNGVPLNPQNFGLDGDNYPDYLDLNSDNDRYQDAIEAYDSSNPASNVGYSITELKALATQFTTNATNAGNNAAALYYRNNLDTDSDTVPDWLEDDDADGIFNYLDVGNSFYHETDQDGWVDFFDPSTFGTEPTPNYAFRENAINVALPIELVTFTAKNNKNQVLLYWETSYEKDNDYFLVERSLDGISFQVVGKVKGAGSSQQLLTYTFPDGQRVNGTSYYRLILVDTSSQTATSPIISVKREGSSLPNITIYPNPTTSQFTLNITAAASEKVQVIISDITGKILQTKIIPVIAGYNAIDFNLEGVPNGIYLVQVTGSAFHLLQRMIKQEVVP
ncbi:hypothetical protein AHMF7605_21775 [Adhaeribacter arboris]|uniref:Uncharacterized protein n=1 Tax=Adhaeribacter arboris TaxID=2072846 RepID=A0A2T2YKA4_9BACT|nr:discoidin domain-containing protein [Adhaeribacter arboris]PSR55943.1 hypothetical protein AHMF7605_21775 [Adhaeribacter arboris]